MNRKTFIETLVRGSIFGLLLVVTGILVSRKKVTLDTCHEGFTCSRCGKLKSCKLPEAKKFNENGKG